LEKGRGQDRLLIVSVGTGAAESLGATAASPNKNIVSLWPALASLLAALRCAFSIFSLLSAASWLPSYKSFAVSWLPPSTGAHILQHRGFALWPVSTMQHSRQQAM
jgi:hypothetical protein